MMCPPTPPAVVEEAIARAAGHAGLSKAELLEALGPRVVDQMIAVAAAGVEHGRIPRAAAEEGITLMVWYLHPRQRFVKASFEGQPVPETSVEFLAALEGLAAKHGVALADLILFLREAAEMRIADALTVLRVIDRIENQRRIQGSPNTAP